MQKSYPFRKFKHWPKTPVCIACTDMAAASMLVNYKHSVCASIIHLLKSALDCTVEAIQVVHHGTRGKLFILIRRIFCVSEYAEKKKNANGALPQQRRSNAV